MGRRINGQIDETHRAMWEGDYLEIALFLFASSEDIFASSEDIPLQGKDDPLLG